MCSYEFQARAIKQSEIYPTTIVPAHSLDITAQSYIDLSQLNLKFMHFHQLLFSYLITLKTLF